MQQDAIAMGIDAAGEDTKKLLFSWADRIVLVDKTFEDRIPEEYRDKLSIWDVGGDRFFRGFEPELIQMYLDYMKFDGDWLDK